MTCCPRRKHVLLDSRLGKLGVSICFESIFPQIARTETLAGARVLCVVTNDSWFKRTQAAREHLMMAQLRAIENRRFVIRAAETGISAVIDPFGRIRSELGLYQRGIISDSVQPRSGLTAVQQMGRLVRLRMRCRYDAWRCSAGAAAAALFARRTSSGNLTVIGDSAESSLT